jgi:hypothetical protein
VFTLPAAIADIIICNPALPLRLIRRVEEMH